MLKIRRKTLTFLKKNYSSQEDKEKVFLKDFFCSFRTSGIYNVTRMQKLPHGILHPIFIWEWLAINVKLAAFTSFEKLRGRFKRKLWLLLKGYIACEPFLSIESSPFHQVSLPSFKAETSASSTKHCAIHKSELGRVNLSKKWKEKCLSFNVKSRKLQ